MSKTLIKNITLVNEGEIKTVDVLVSGERIEKIAKNISAPQSSYDMIEAEGLYMLPGMIDDQVHFREPGLTHKATINSESKAALAGGITSFMDMPNTIPNVLTLELLEEKYELAARNSLANYSFFMGINKSNLEDALAIDNSSICGLSDDGLYFDHKEGILANHPDYLEKLFSRSNSLIALHCEDDSIIETAFSIHDYLFDGNIPISSHALIRSEKACVEATKRVIQLAEKHNSRLHVLHVSTAAETQLFKNNIPLREKRITGEACLHHLWFTDEDYQKLGNSIKWNPSIKSRSDRDGLLKALKENKLDIIASDHAPHLISEKSGIYTEVKSGGPLVQHAFPLLLEFYHDGVLSLPEIVQRTSHNVAELYRLKNRGYLREGYYADMVLIDLNSQWKVTKQNLLYKCAWSPLENQTFRSKVVQTMVNGHLAYDHGTFNEEEKGKRLLFEKER